MLYKLFITILPINDLSICSGRYIPDPYTPPYVSHQPDLHHIRLGTEDRYTTTLLCTATILAECGMCCV